MDLQQCRSAAPSLFPQQAHSSQGEGGNNQRSHPPKLIVCFIFPNSLCPPSTDFRSHATFLERGNSKSSLWISSDQNAFPQPLLSYPIIHVFLHLPGISLICAILSHLLIMKSCSVRGQSLRKSLGESQAVTLSLPPLAARAAQNQPSRNRNITKTYFSVTGWTTSSPSLSLPSPLSRAGDIQGSSGDLYFPLVGSFLIFQPSQSFCLLEGDLRKMVNSPADPLTGS